MDLETLFRTQYASVWRLLRRLGIPRGHLDDLAQEVFWVAARRLNDIRPGSENSFLYGVALRVAANERRRCYRQPIKVPSVETDFELPSLMPSPEEQVQRLQARKLLDVVLSEMSPELRAVIVLFELEGLEVRQIAAMEDVPLGTASSRLRRAREEFSAISKRLRAKLERQERYHGA